MSDSFIAVMPSFRQHDFLFTCRFSFGRGGAVEAYWRAMF